MVLSLKVIGYYEHDNFGDDQYKLSFVELLDTYLYEHYRIEFLDCDKINNNNFSDTDIIIIGGGDVLNEYFLTRIKRCFLGKPNLIIALSVGLPYTNILVETDLLEIIDYIFIRTLVDLNNFKKYFYEDRIFYLPDVSYILSNNYNFVKNIINNNYDIDLQSSVIIQNDNSLEYTTFIKNIRDKDTSEFKDKYVIGICLSRHFYNKNYKDEYNNILNKLTDTISEYILNKDCILIFIPFNTNNINPNENDTLIADDII